MSRFAFLTFSVCLDVLAAILHFRFAHCQGRQGPPARRGGVRARAAHPAGNGLVIANLGDSFGHYESGFVAQLHGPGSTLMQYHPIVHCHASHCALSICAFVSLCECTSIKYIIVFRTWRYFDFQVYYSNNKKS